MSNALELVRRGYEAYERRDFAAVFAVLDPAIEIYQTDALPWGGEYRGLEQARGFFQRLNEFTDGGPQPERFFEAGEDVIAIGRLRGRARATGREFDLPIVHRWTVRGDLIVRFEAFIDTPGMLHALGRAPDDRA